MKVNELTAAQVVDETSEAAGYYGSQYWFPQGWKRMSGCGATAAAGAAAALALNKGMTSLLGPAHADGNRIAKDDFVALMLEMFSRMTPRIMGYPYAAKWGRAFKQYAEERGVSLESDVYDHWSDWKDAFGFVKDHIDEGIPVPALVLYHRAPEMQEELWHWVMISGYTEPDEGDAADEAHADAEAGAGALSGAANAAVPQVIVSDCAERDLYSAEIFLDADTRNLVKLVDLSF